MRLTRQQIERMADAIQNGGNESKNTFAIEETDGGQIRFYAVELVEQKTAVALGTGLGKVKA